MIVVPSLFPCRLGLLCSYVEVVDAFTGAGASTLGTVRDYILRCLGSEDRLLEADGSVIAQYAADRTKLREIIVAKKKDNFVFNLNRKCDACNHQIDMPCVFFICNHAFHTHCFEVGKNFF